LVVEDDADTSAMYRAVLESDGFSVEQAVDGIEALFRAKARPPALVLLDVGLPRLDGFYLAELWRGDPAMAQVPILAVSAFLDGDNRDRALQAGCDDALEKPFALPELRRAVRKLLRLPDPKMEGSGSR